MVNPLCPYMAKKSLLSLVKVMVWAIWTNADIFQLGPLEWTLVKFESRCKSLSHENALENTVGQILALLFNPQSVSSQGDHQK